MASTTGTATSFQDIYDDLITFLTTDTDLVSAGQEWVVQREIKHNIAAVTSNMVFSDEGWSKIGRAHV